jgi:hypothetical protein
MQIVSIGSYADDCETQTMLLQDKPREVRFVTILSVLPHVLSMCI